MLTTEIVHGIPRTLIKLGPIKEIKLGPIIEMKLGNPIAEIMLGKPMAEIILGMPITEIVLGMPITEMVLMPVMFMVDGTFPTMLIIEGTLIWPPIIEMVLGTFGLIMLITLGKLTLLVITIELGITGVSSNVITLGIGKGFIMLIVLGTTIGPNGPISKHGNTIGGNCILFGRVFTTAKSKFGKSGSAGIITGKLLVAAKVVCVTSSVLNLSADV